MHLAEIGYVTECGALLRIVGDFCEEISTIAMALQAVYDGKPMNADVQAFVDNYFLPIAKSHDEFAAQAKVRHVSRERLLLAKIALSPDVPGIGSDLILKLARYINKVYDGFVHGYLESTMELWNPERKAYDVQGSPDGSVRAEFVEATLFRFHGLVAAIELTAIMTGCDEVFRAARTARRKLDELGISADTRPR